MADEDRYTLEEARRIIAQQTCAMRNHQYEIIESIGAGPSSLICGRCGKSWDVVASTRTRGDEDA